MTRKDFSSLVLGYMGELTAYTRRLTRDADAAQDLLQDAYERAFAAWSSLDDPARCKAWLFRIARNLHIDRQRARTARPELRLVTATDVVLPEPAIGPRQIDSVEARDLENLLNALPDDQREAVLLHDVWGFAYDEIAAITDVPIGTVRSRLARGRARLASWLTEPRTQSVHESHGRSS